MFYKYLRKTKIFPVSKYMLNWMYVHPQINVCITPHSFSLMNRLEGLKLYHIFTSVVHFCVLITIVRRAEWSEIRYYSCKHEQEASYIFYICLGRTQRKLSPMEKSCFSTPNALIHVFMDFIALCTSVQPCWNRRNHPLTVPIKSGAWHYLKWLDMLKH